MSNAQPWQWHHLELSDSFKSVEMEQFVLSDIALAYNPILSHQKILKLLYKN